jgi:hypothetical protein
MVTGTCYVVARPLKALPIRHEGGCWSRGYCDVSLSIAYWNFCMDRLRFARELVLG